MAVLAADRRGFFGSPARSADERRWGAMNGATEQWAMSNEQ
jgi:hypothetical protein